jgi:transposase
MENYRFPKTDKQRAELAAQIGADGVLLLAQVDQATTMPWLREVEAIVTLRQVWADQFTDPPGPLGFKEGPERTAAAQSIPSPYDPEARYSTKREMSWVGYKVHLTETCDRTRPNLITDVLTTVATSPDENKLPVVLEALKERGLLPAEHLVDAGYTDAGVLATSQETYGVSVTAPVTPDPSWQSHENTGFDKTKFVVDWEAQVVTCPAGKTSRSWLASTKPKDQCAYSVRFAKKDCDACVHRSACTRSKKEPRELTLQTQAEYEALHAARRRQKTPEFKEAYQARSGIESTHEQGIRRCGLREARYLGLAKTRLQHILTAAALNLVRVNEWLFGAPRAKTSVSRFAQLAPAT